ncbi:MAG: hypothetical protein LH467_01855 [Gemmatimonadaceae bacterium]|nr:hypothetical protein [Gemmatimonadaceae bacterium]
MRPNSVVLAATTVVGITLCVGPLGAQTADSTRRWSLFGGTIVAQGTALHRPPGNLEVGGSADFRVASFPLPLRASLAFSSVEQDLSGSGLKYGTFSIDAIGRPVPRILGTQLYFLGGFGLATRAEYTALYARYTGIDPLTTEYYTSRAPRQNWAFLETGVGLEIGRAFVQMKLQMPVASAGIRRAPISVGFRF